MNISKPILDLASRAKVVPILIGIFAFLFLMESIVQLRLRREERIKSGFPGHVTAQIGRYGAGPAPESIGDHAECGFFAMLVG